jgi:uncharacterized membrane protein (TIGR02234 family)
VTPRRELTAAALLCVVGAGAPVAAGGRTWATVQASGAITPILQSVTGRELAAGAVAFGWAGLAGLAALFATRGRVRAAVGALLALFGAAIGYVSVTAVGRAHVLDVAADKSALLRPDGGALVHATGWWITSAAGGVLLLAAGAVTLLRGARWPGMSARYDPGVAERRPDTGDAAALWKSLDRGEDPTEGGPEHGTEHGSEHGSEHGPVHGGEHGSAANRKR